MSCCGSKRAALNSSAPLPAAAAAASSGALAPSTFSAPQTLDALPLHYLRYLGDATLTVRGATSGQMYGFSPQQISAVQAGDMQAFINTGLFEAAPF